MIGVLGGSFDPIHFGHLRPALEIKQQLVLDELRFLPANISPFKQASAISTVDRLNMINLAIASVDGFSLDDREAHREGPSYTIDTVHQLRREYPCEPIVFIVGADAFNGFRSWKKWGDILKNVHLLVTHRPGFQLNKSDWSSCYWASYQQELMDNPAGKILHMAVTQLDISSSFIRAELKKGANIRFLLPDAVCDYIVSRRLYCK